MCLARRFIRNLRADHRTRHREFRLVVDAWPNEAAAADFVAMHRRYRHEATPANAEHVPVRTVSPHTGFTLGSDCDFPEWDGL